jgi:hypothetical protein
MKLLRRWVGIALLAPMLVLAVSASSFIGIRCRMSGMVSLAACCPEVVPGPASSQSSIDEPGCCERVVVQAIKPISSAVSEGEGAFHPTPATLVAYIDFSNVTQPAVERAIAHGDPPVALRVPLRLLKRSLLI